MRKGGQRGHDCSLFCICLVWFLIALYSPKLDASFKVYNLIWCQQVITLEGWSDIMYFVQDAHSFWNWIYFVVLIVVRERLLRKYQTWIIMLSYFIPSCLSPTTLALPSLSLLSPFSPSLSSSRSFSNPACFPHSPYISALPSQLPLLHTIY